MNAKLWLGNLAAIGLAWMFVGCARPVAPAVRVNTSNVAALRTAMGGDKVATGGTPAVAAANPTGWATLKGTFKINGTAPTRPPLNIDKEQDVCMPGGKPVLSETVVVDSASGGIKNIFIYLETKYPAGDAAWEHPDAIAAHANEAIFDQKNCVFLSRGFAARVGQTVKVLNSDPVGHNTKLDGSGGAQPDNFIVSANASAIYVPAGESPEPFGVSCSIHPWMSAYFLARKSPYFAVTDAKGQFELKNVPAGVPLKFRVWQEKTKFVPSATVTGLVEKDKFGKGRLEITLKTDETRDLELKIDGKVLGGS